MGQFSLISKATLFYSKYDASSQLAAMNWIEHRHSPCWLLPWVALKLVCSGLAICSKHSTVIAATAAS